MAAAFKAAAKAAAKANEENQRQIKAMDEMMEKAFVKLDMDNSGKLDINEMLAALKKIGYYDQASSTAEKVKARVLRAAGEDKEFDLEEYKQFIKAMRLERNKWTTPVDLPHNLAVKQFYQSALVQGLVALVIVINFLAIIVEKEIDPYDPANQQFHGFWVGLDTVCSIIFTIELAVNLYGSFWRPFVSNPWNYLDTVVVIVGIITMANVSLPPGVDKVKILRAFRILRLFKRIKSLNKILVALVRSIPGVMNAFIVMFIFMAIFAVLAVDLFRDFGNGVGQLYTEEGVKYGGYPTIQRFGPADATWGPDGARYLGSDVDPKLFVEVTATQSAMTARGFHYGQEYFGTFSRSLYTLFQVLTGESWSEAVARPLIFGWSPANSIVAGTFFTLYILLTAIILQNVVVTVLLDKFLIDDDAEQAAEDKSEDAKMAEAMSKEDDAAAAKEADGGERAGTGAPSGAGASRDDLASLQSKAQGMQKELDATKELCKSLLLLLPESNAK